MKLTRSVAALMACLTVLSTSAYGAVTAAVLMGPLTITLYDLAPGDGIAPSINFLLPPADGSHVNSITGEIRSSTKSEYHSYDASSPFNPVSASWSLPTVHMQSSISGNGDISSLQLAAYGFATDRSRFSTILTSPDDYFGFTLSPYTMASFSVNAYVHAETSVGWPPGGWWANSESAYARAWLEISGPPPASETDVDWPAGQRTDAQLSVYTNYVYDPVTGIVSGASATQTALLGGTFVNLTDYSRGGGIRLSAYLSGESPFVSAVPEPGSGLLLLGGLSILYLLRRGSRRPGGAMRRLLLSVAIGAGAGATLPAMAEVSSSATSGALNIVLYDLNLNDGVTPWLTFATAQSEASGAVYLSPDRYEYIEKGNAAFGNAAGSTSLPQLFHAQSAVTGDGTSSGFQSVSASGYALSAPWPSNLASSYTAYASAQEYSSQPNFTISANTMVLFLSSAEVHASATIGGYSWFGITERANAGVSLAVEGPTPFGGPGKQSSSNSISADAYEIFPQDLYKSGPLSVSFTNLTAADMSGNFRMSAGASGSPNVSTIPEPATVLMWGVGLLGLAFCAQKRRARPPLFLI